MEAAEAGTGPRTVAEVIEARTKAAATAGSAGTENGTYSQFFKQEGVAEALAELKRSLQVHAHDVELPCKSIHVAAKIILGVEAGFPPRMLPKAAFVGKLDDNGVALLPAGYSSSKTQVDWNPQRGKFFYLLLCGLLGRKPRAKSWSKKPKKSTKKSTKPNVPAEGGGVSVAPAGERGCICLWLARPQ